MYRTAIRKFAHLARYFGAAILRHRVLGCLFLVISFAVATKAQQRIVGIVMDEKSDVPIAATTVRLECESLPLAIVASTDSHGAFAFPNLSPGPYTLRVEADTFYPRVLTLNLRPRDTAQLTVKLSRISYMVESVVVQAEHKLLDETQAATVTNLAANEIESLPAARRTQLTDIITPYVSSAVAGHDNFVHLRGNELSLNTFINGVSFFDNPHQIFTPGISPDIVQSVNVFTGGFPAEFGNRFGGILDVVTRGGFDANGHGSVTVGSGNFLRNNIAFDYGGHTNKFGYFFYGQGFESDRFLNTPERERFNDKGTGSRTFAQFDYRAAANDTFRLVMTGDGTNFELPNTTEDQARGRDFFERNREQTAIFSWEHAFSPTSMLVTSAYERFASSRLVATNDPESIQADGLRNDIAAGVKSDYSLFLGSKHSIKMGVDVAAFRLREDFLFDPRDNEVEIDAFDFRGRKTGGEQSAYIQDKIRVTPSFTADLGIRFDHYNLVTSAHEFSPRINLAYSLNQHRTVIHFAYNRFFSPPSIENLLLSSRLGFDGLPPQISRSNFIESGVSQSITDKFVLRATAFWRADENSFENTELANVRIFAPTTFAKGRSFGLEISGQIAEIPKTGLSGYFSYTAQRAFQTGPVSGGFTIENVEAGETGPAAFDQIHTAVAGVTERHSRSGVFATAQFEYGSGTPVALPGADGEETLIRLPGHFVTNLYFGIDLFRKERHKLTLQFNVENVGNRVYQIAKESEFTPIQFSPPRFISGSLKVRF